MRKECSENLKLTEHIDGKRNKGKQRATYLTASGINSGKIELAESYKW